MWILVQFVVSAIVIGLASILPNKKIYFLVTLLLILASVSMIFMPWLVAIQILNIIISSICGYGIIEDKNKKYKSKEEEEDIKKIAKKIYHENINDIYKR